MTTTTFPPDTAHAFKCANASRRRVRKAHPKEALKSAIMAAAKSGRGAEIHIGGSVANAYRYPASTEAAGAVAVRLGDHHGVGFAGWGELPANKVTYCGAAAATIGWSQVWDGRSSASTKKLAQDRMYAHCLAHGDVRWRVSPFTGRGYYVVRGLSGVTRFTMPAPHRPLPTAAQVARFLRRIVPPGYSVVISAPTAGSDKLLAAIREDATGEQYHCGDIQRGWLTTAMQAFAQRAAAKVSAEERARAEALIETAEGRGIWVCLADSLRAGNCRAGSESFADRHGLRTDRHYPAGALLNMANGDARYVRAAAIAAIRRHNAEMERGYALLAEHRA